ncbi:hypothetical protein OKW21_005534 [Catalinimonas alkaloidigena]|uniref:hypothetical protein n=1 Tax=Catalinimonas alkaloidigena TaxID=1075417 RepID=UPI002405AE01|nr:hypothetical protein [Catalinimonas alkaloidigena]MDF9800271.1 hypothetical protein [Catalinimonas alkaloidigena]
MKYCITKASFMICLTFWFVTNLAYAQEFADWYYTEQSNEEDCAQKVMQENEHQRSEPGRDAIIHCNPLLLNGNLLDYGAFNTHSRGVLTVMKGEPDSAEAQRIPFKLYLRREGKLLERAQIGFAQDSKYEIEISQVLAHSLPGDQLIIDPVKKEHWKAKRILKILDAC